MRRTFARLPAAVLLAGALVLVPLLTPGPAAASSNQVSLFEDDVQMLQNPAATLQDLRHLGVTTVRFNLRWSEIAPSPNSRRRPRFNASNPNAYPRNAWKITDQIVGDARKDGIQLMFVPTGFAPLWAQGANPGKYGCHYNTSFAFMPSVKEYKQFVTAVGRRYPSVHTWELYNEANFGEDLCPQGINGSQVLYAPVMYRALAGAAWNALHATGHGRDTILIGALAARGAVRPANRGTGSPGAYGETPPITFIRELYCLDSHYRQYRGAAAAVRKCPMTPGASRRFRSQNPALFSASGWSVHPYPLTNDAHVPPNRTSYHNPDYVSFSQIPNMIRTLDRIQRGYGSGKRFPVWNTEFGYITNPPNASRKYPNVSLANQAYYDNWAEYLAWRNPRIASTMQYLLVDPQPTIPGLECGGFASGLIFYGAAPTSPGCSRYTPGLAKPGYYAYRLPIYVANPSARAGGAVTVWGCVRPAHFAVLDLHTPQVASIQFQQGSRGGWTTVSTVTIPNPAASCYFNVPVRLPGSGSIRLAYSYPPNDPLLAPPAAGNYTDPLRPAVSRSVGIKIG